MRKLLPLLTALSIIVAYLCAGAAGRKESAAAGRAGGLPAQVSRAQKEGIAPGGYIDAFVTRVVDGDTLEVTYKGETQKVRLLYADAPESAKPGTQAQPFAKEAAGFTAGQVLQKPVRLVFEKGLRDGYGRLLAHVILKNGAYLNGMLVRNGLARAEAVPPNTAYGEYFTRLEKEAARAGAGIWKGMSDK